MKKITYTNKLDGNPVFSEESLEALLEASKKPIRFPPLCRHGLIKGTFCLLCYRDSPKPPIDTNI